MQNTDTDDGQSTQIPSSTLSQPGGNSDLSEFFQDGLFNIDPTDHSFMNAFRSNVASVIEHRLIPYIIELFGRYTEDDFHTKMRNMYMHNGRMYTGFNFIADWKKNHKPYWKMSIGAARASKRLIKFNQDSMLHKITTVMYMNGWTLNDYEIEGLKQTVQRIYNIMYLGNDV